LIEAGYYPNRSELMMDALRYLFSKRQDLRLASAIELYQEGKVTLSRATEMAGMVSEEFKDVLVEKGLKIRVESLSDEEYNEGLKLIKDIREKR
jgi:predicted HTH domain antitoxin